MFAQRIQHLTSSIIREILAAAQQPGVISFAGGLPAAASFPAHCARLAPTFARPALTNAGYKNSDFMAGWISYRF